MNTPSANPIFSFKLNPDFPVVVSLLNNGIVTFFSGDMDSAVEVSKAKAKVKLR